MNKELRKMSRRELLEILLNQSKKIDELTKELEDKNIKIKNSSSLAEASLKLNHIFEDADAAAKQYLDNIIKLEAKLEKELANKKTAKKKATKTKKEATPKSEKVSKEAKSTKKKTTTKKEATPKSEKVSKEVSPKEKVTTLPKKSSDKRKKSK